MTTDSITPIGPIGSSIFISSAVCWLPTFCIERVVFRFSDAGSAVRAMSHLPSGDLYIQDRFPTWLLQQSWLQTVLPLHVMHLLILHACVCKANEPIPIEPIHHMTTGSMNPLHWPMSLLKPMSHIHILCRSAQNKQRQHDRRVRRRVTVAPGGPMDQQSVAAWPGQPQQSGIGGTMDQQAVAAWPIGQPLPQQQQWPVSCSGAASSQGFGILPPPPPAVQPLVDQYWQVCCSHHHHVMRPMSCWCECQLIRRCKTPPLLFRWLWKAN